MFHRGIEVTLAYDRIRQTLSHTCHTGVDETWIIMEPYTNIEACFDSQNPIFLPE